MTPAAAMSRRPRWVVNGARDCRGCEGSGEVVEGCVCLKCLGTGTMPADWGRDPLTALRAARIDTGRKVLYPRIRAAAMRAVVLP